MAMTLIECDTCDEYIVNGECECTDTQKRIAVKRSVDNRTARHRENGFAPRNPRGREMAARAYKILNSNR